MKKNLKCNKVLLTSLLGLAVVASSTAAFSTWIFGIINKESEQQLTIEVDTTKNQSLVLTANATNKVLRVGEDTKPEGQTYVNVDVYADALKFVLDEFKITFSSGTVTPTAINFTLVDNSNITKIHVDKNNDYFTRREGDYSYIELAQESINLTTNDNNSVYTSTSDGNSNTVWDIQDKTIEFKWGTFFNYTYTTEGSASITTSKPSEFYNKKISEKTDDTEKLNAIKKGQDELDAMKAALMGVNKSITLKIDVVYANK